MFNIGHAHDVSFKVNVMGTSAEPTARLVLGCTPELSFPARKVTDGWACTVTIPTGIEAGSYPLRVEVIVNNRHFTPLVKQVEVAQLDTPSIEPQAELAAPKIEEPEEKVEEPTEELPIEPASDFKPQEVDEIPFVATVEPQDDAQPKTEVPRISIIQMVADREKPKVAETADAPKLDLPVFTPKPIEAKPIDVATVPKPGLSALKKVVEAPAVAKQVFQPVVTPLPKPSEVKSTEVKVKLNDIAKVAEKIEPKAKPVEKPRKKVKPVVELKQELPVKLIKGEIIYE